MQVTVDVVQESPAGVTSSPSAPMTFTVATSTPGTPTINPLPANIANASAARFLGHRRRRHHRHRPR